MKHTLTVAGVLCAVVSTALGAVDIDEDTLGVSLGGWKKSGKKYAQYRIADTTYRSYRPEATMTPDGGTYVSLRIDHVRGWFSSDDHAILEITIDRHGDIVSAQSNIAIQGQSISSDVIMGVSNASQKVPTGIDRAVQIGTDLVANLSSKLLRAKIVEAGRVTFPSAVRHNYNLLYQSIRVDDRPVNVVATERAVLEQMVPPRAIPVVDVAKPVPSPELQEVKDQTKSSPKSPMAFDLGSQHAVPLEIRSYNGVSGASSPEMK